MCLDTKSYKQVLMKVVSLITWECDTNTPCPVYITKGEIYDAELTPQMYDPISLNPYPNDNMLVRCKDGNSRYLPKEHFITLANYREQQINEILNEK